MFPTFDGQNVAINSVQDRLKMAERPFVPNTPPNTRLLNDDRSLVGRGDDSVDLRSGMLQYSIISRSGSILGKIDTHVTDPTSFTSH